MTWVILICVMVIMWTMAGALFYLYRSDNKNRDSMVKTLSMRIGLSVVLFIGLLWAYDQGWLVPSAHIWALYKK